MQCYRCDWCGRDKAPHDRWVLGLAAEHVGTTARRREVSIADRWSEKLARHPLAVHFCNPDHAARYIDRVLDLDDSAVQAAPPGKKQAGKTKAGAGNRTAVRVSGEKRVKTTAQGAKRKLRAGVPKFNKEDALRARSWGIRL